MTYHTTTLLPAQLPNSCGGWSISGPQGSVLSKPQILDPSMKDWYQYQPWNITHGVQLSNSMHMTYHTTALSPNSCAPMADGPFWNPKGRSYPYPKYYTHRWRIDINIGHGISPIGPDWENQCIWHIIGRHYYQIAAAQWWMVLFGTPRVGPIHTRNMRAIDEELISISAMESHP